MSGSLTKPSHKSMVPTAKIVPPTGPTIEVQRSALHDRYTVTRNPSLVLVHAPAGFGKTTVMLQLNRHLQLQNIDTAWLTLDRADNDVSRFVACLEASVSGWLTRSANSLSSMDISEFLSSRPAPFAVFLDDFEIIHAPAVLAIVRSLIEALPLGGQIIVGSRIQPDIGVARLRARGRLLELGPNALRFNLDETGEYFQLRQQTALPKESLKRLHGKTEGWIAALWLASLSMERSGVNSDFVERFSITDQAIADFLADDVLAHQPSAVREFLLRTSILRYLEPSLCDILVPGSNSESLLKTLESQNIFLSSIANKEHSYRYHSLFSSFLRTRLRAEHAGDVQQLHLKAAHWYEQNSRFASAIDHAIKGNDAGYALRLLNEYAQNFLEEGRMRLLARWFNAIPEDALSTYPVLQATAVWAVLFTSGPVAAHAMLTHSGCGGSDDPMVLAHVNAQLPLFLAMEDRYGEALAVGRESLARLPSCSRFADSVLRNAMANVFTVSGDSAEARRLIDSARRIDGESMFTRMYAESQEGLLNLMAGRLQQATACFRMALSATGTMTSNLTSGNAWAGLLYACALYESNDFDGAEQLVNVYLPSACDVGLPDHMYLGHMIRARIAFSRGDVSTAFGSLTELEYLGHYRHLPRIVSSAKLERGRLLLLQGNAQASKEELDRAIDSPVGGCLSHQRLLANEINALSLARIRWDIHFGDAFAALSRLDHELIEALREGRHLRVIKLRVLKSLALQRTGDAAEAVKAIAELIRTIAAEGIIQVIAEEGEQMYRIVHRYKVVLEEMPMKSSDQRLLSYLQVLISAFGSSSLPSEQPTSLDALMEPLTRKELHVLQLTADGCSNATMADKLNLSDSTVRTHLRNISSKLNAHSRAEAVATARRLSLIR
ncbi:LuxR family maltose regulon positive regulatory protein [Pseudomonas sp. SJZ103]|uniref:LuxR C-terminal-related transcriptional regulator n=1 Tax=unclassified Pseudomonas TaxID=196821 RepID=UPI0011A99F13|nr:MULTISPECIES: LuxR C-terminal-related transcriptional regulator [unclassified Pseudomonas]TWC63137.1 LuxR family maltose regulon positive regulatory protein [Pseudomonas sp. SJZ103]TWC80174.1 LuxR family maltose regulon positive regulatory protein [Pseudomonas sp. SJZ094]